MATGTLAKGRPTAAVRESMFHWEGRDKNGRVVKGDMRAGGESVVAASLRRRGIMTTKIKKQSFSRGKKITEKDLALFSRQLSTMLKAGVPLMQSFDIVGKGHANPSMARLMNDIRSDVETGTSLNQAFRKYPLYFDPLFCNLVAAGEQAGILETLLDRLATYQEKTIALKGKIKKAMFYPIMIILVAILVTAVIMIFVIPSFKSVFTSFGADLPAPTLMVIAMSDFMVAYWYVVFGIAFRKRLFPVASVAKITQGQSRGRPCPVEAAGIGGDVAEGIDCTLEQNARHHFCCRRAAGRSAGLGRTCGRKLGLQGSDQAGTERGQHRHKLGAVDAEHRRLSKHGDSDDVDWRGIRIARFDAVQSRGLLRARSRRNGRCIGEFAGANDHGHSGRRRRRHCHRNLSADLQARPSCIVYSGEPALLRNAGNG